MSRHCAVIGHPATHSLSPALHRAAYEALGLDWHYEAIDVEPGGVDAFIAGLDATWRALSVTMPHKEAVAAMGEQDSVVRLTGVANTLLLDAPRRVFNTDVAGFQHALAHHGTTRLESATIVGNGATARSALVASALLGARRATVVVRTPVRAAGMIALADGLGVEATVALLGDSTPVSDLLISTVPSAGVAQHAAALVDRSWLAFDAIYHPWPTPLGAAAHEAGVPVLSGLHLLAGQAVDQVRHMTGGDVSFELLLHAGLAELQGRDAPAGHRTPPSDRAQQAAPDGP